MGDAPQISAKRNFFPPLALARSPAQLCGRWPALSRKQQATHRDGCDFSEGIASFDVRLAAFGYKKHLGIDRKQVA